MALDKLKFWKKKDEDFPEFGMERERGGGVGPAAGSIESIPASGMPSTDADLPGMGLPGTYTPPTTGTGGFGESTLVQKDLEIISAKIDALKADLEQINQRLANIEAGLGQQRTHTPRYGYP